MIEKQVKIVKLQISDSDIKVEITENMFPFEMVNNVEIIDGMNDEDRFSPSTLKDISIIMYSMVGNGVTWQLADDLAKRLGGNPYEISETLNDIFREYYDLTDEEDYERWKSSPKLYPPIT